VRLQVVAFEPFAPAALFLRIAVTVFVIHREQMRLEPPSPAQVAYLGASCAAAWVALFAAKAALGFSLRGIAAHFLRRHPKA
jgi:hypothetical protein